MSLHNFVDGNALNYFAKKIKQNISTDLLDGKKLRYVTQEEYNALSDEQKNDNSFVWTITDAEAINTNSIVRPYEIFRVEETIFGKTGYIDVETMEPAVKYGLTEEYLDCSSFAFVIPTAITPYSVMCIAASFQVSDLMVTEKWEGDPSKGEEGLYIIVKGLNIDYKINIKHKESKDGITIESIRNTKYLDINNTKEFIPTGDYQPTTKKYVDESIGGVIKELPIYEFNANGTAAYINLTDLEFNETYTLNTEKYPNVTVIFIRRYFEDGTFKLIRNFSGVNVKSIFRLANPQLEGVDVALCSTSIYSTFQFYIKLGTSKDDCTVEWFPCYVSPNNTHKYEPTGDYNPATKKYVDDLVSNIDLNDYITDTELEGKGYITDTELEEEMIFETDSLTVNSLGGISANTDLNGLTVKEILNKLLFPYIEPVITVTVTPNGGTYEKGNTQTITNVSVSITKKSEIITKIEVLNGTQVLARQQDEAINNGGTFNYNVNVSVPSTNKQLTVKVTDNSGNAITKTTNSFTFVYPYYYGVCDEGTTINGDLIKSLTKSVTSKGTKTVTYTTNNQRMIFAYPKSYGVITKILDPNSFDVTSTFTMSQITIIGLDGTGQSYYVYVNSPSTVSNFNMKFSY